MYNKNTWLYKICFKKGYKKHERNTWILKKLKEGKSRVGWVYKEKFLANYLPW